MKNIAQLILVWMFVLIYCSMCQIRNTESIILESGEYVMEVNKKNLSIRFVDQHGKIIVPHDSVSGVFINSEPVVSSEIIEKQLHELLFASTSSGGSKAKVKIAFDNGICFVSIEPEIKGESKASLRFGGMPLAHGLGDAGGWNDSFDLAGEEQKTFNIRNDGGRMRWLSTFTIFPQNNFAGVFFDRGKKSVVLSESNYQLNTEIEGTSTFYLFVGEPKEIYANYKRVRNENGYEDIEPKSRLFELGWESWDALGWNTNQFTVKDILAKFHQEGYPIRWAVTGSGFWDEGGTTTSFGRYGEKFPDTDSFKNWMHQNDIYWMIGLRTNLIPSGGPYYPKTKKRDKNLKVSSYYGNELSDDALAQNLLLTDREGQARLITSSIFPIVPCYLLDGNKPGAASWYLKNYRKWKVDGIKEDTMMDLEDETSIFNKPIVSIAKDGGHVMVRCGEFSAPGTLSRINDTNVSAMQNRTPINYMQFAASAAPNVYSDVAGVHNMHNQQAIDANIRHTWLLSLTAGMAVGAFPTKWSPEEQKIFKKTIDFHYSLVPYLYSAGMQSFKTGYPYTLTPMSIAYADDDNTMNMENFQWMIGESILAAPLLKNYKEGKMDVYLPDGTWFDWETGDKFFGPVTLGDYKIALQKVPCFVGGKGIVVLRKNKTHELTARVYEVGKLSTSVFYTLKGGRRYKIEVATSDLKNASVHNVSTGESVSYTTAKGYIEFPIVEGSNYKVM